MYQVLIVEDDPMVAMINEQYVSRGGAFQVAGTCRDGDSALAFLEQQSVDLVILDVFMPHTDGLELLHRIRERGLPVAAIMVTAANDPATLEAALRLGAVDYLVKPFTLDRFRAALEKFVVQTEALKGSGTLDQANIDSIMGAPRAEAPGERPKGIQEKTLQVILACLRDAKPSWLTGDALAERTGLSAVTVRRYLNYLMQTGAVSGEMNYETGGRPSMLYRIARQ